MSETPKLLGGHSIQCQRTVTIYTAKRDTLLAPYLAAVVKERTEITIAKKKKIEFFHKLTLKHSYSQKRCMHLRHFR